jgi:hypothetical protein
MFDLKARNLGLPPDAVAKLRKLQDAMAALHAAYMVASDRAREARAEVAFYGEAVEAVVRAQGRHAGAPTREMQQAEANKRVAVEELRAREERREAASIEQQAAGAVVQKLEDWLRKHNSRVAFVPFDAAATPELRKGESVQDAVARVRGEVAALRAERERIASAPLPSSEVKAAARAEVERMAEAAVPRVAHGFVGRPIIWPKASRHTHTGEHDTAEFFDARALVFWAHKDAILARLNAEIDAAADDGAAVSTERRKAEAVRLSAAILAAEREEEALIEAAPPGLLIQRRPDHDPRAILGLSDDLPGYEAA